MKIVICGSMTSVKKMVEIEKELLELGWEVVLPDFTHEYAQMDGPAEIGDESVKNKVKYDLISGYYNKIAESDAVLIVNIDKNGVENYIGGNAFLEIGFAHVLNKAVFLLNEIPQVAYRDEIEAMKPVVIDGDLKAIKI